VGWIVGWKFLNEASIGTEFGLLSPPQRDTLKPKCQHAEGYGL
jgi:hypothetical protein